MRLDQLREFERVVLRLMPFFRLAWKDETWSQKVIGYLTRPFNPSYMTGYVSTFYPIVYFASKEGYEAKPLSSFISLSHEYVHLEDTRRHPVWFRVSYLFPQILAVPLFCLGVVLSFFVGWWSVPLFLLANLSLLPWPAKWRVHWEERGYLMTLAVLYWMYGSIPASSKVKVKMSFVGWSYYRMSWSEDQVTEWFARSEARILDGSLKSEPIYREVYQFLVSQGLAVV